MTDDELVGRLRRLFAERAGNPEPAAHHSQGPLPTPAERYDTAGAPDPRTRRRRRRALAGGALAGAAAVAAAAVSVGGGHGGRTTVAPAAPTPTAPGSTAAAPPSTVAHSAGTPTTRPVPTSPLASAPVPVPTTVRVAATVPPPAVPTGFSPLSTSFTSETRGWSFGFAPCGARYCPVLATTSDAGRTWRASTSPPAGSFPAGGGLPQGSWQVRFADSRDGWIRGGSGTERLWSTHDGAVSWSEVKVAGAAEGSIADLEASAGRAYLVAEAASSPAQEIWSTPAGSDAWTAAPTTLPLGAGPVPVASIVTSGGRAWVVVGNRTTLGGARLDAGGTWSSWDPPCLRANGSAAVSALSAGALAAVCNEGVWGPGDAGTVPGRPYLFTSSDGGTSFGLVSALPGDGGGIGSVAGAPGDPRTVVAADDQGLLATFDGGATWARVYRAQADAVSDFVGFTTATQAVAIVREQASSLMLMSRDGGRTWTAAHF